jgi:GNAT superfamily N-acetyltransferase
MNQGTNQHRRIERVAQTEEPNPTESEIEIRPFRPGDETAFRRLNEEWIVRYFRIEPKDEKTFADPQGAILDHGGRIYFAVLGKECVGCCALLRRGENEFEVGKMAVSTDHQGQGIGRLLLLAVIDEARRAGATRLYLETNDVLTPAIRLYESEGFTRLDPVCIAASPYARSNVAMELNLV